MNEIVTTGFEDFGFKYLIIRPFDKDYVYYSLNQLKWNKVYDLDSVGTSGEYPCYTVTLPQEMIKLGISKVQFYFNPGTFFTLYVHQEGLYGTELPGAYLSIALGQNIKLPVEYEQVPLQHQQLVPLQ